jgi:predicted  nucleic acid-binding Zn-ribbon protein
MVGLAETKDRTSRVESDVAGLREAMADGSAKVEEVRREVVGVKAQLWDCCPKVKHDLANLERELAKLKEEMREL